MTCIKDEHYTRTRHSYHFNCILVQHATRTSSPMAQVLIIGILTLLCLQLAAGHTTARVDALNTLSANAASCTAILDNPLIISIFLLTNYTFS